MAYILDLVGNISSVAGLGITVWILVKLGRIHRSYLLRARFPDLRRKLRRHCSNLVLLLKSYPDSAGDVRIELQKCQATLRSLGPKLGGALRAEVEGVEKEISRVCALSEAGPEKQVWEIYGYVVALEQEVDNLMKDMQWRPGR